MSKRSVTAGKSILCKRHHVTRSGEWPVDRSCRWRTFSRVTDVTELQWDVSTSEPRPDRPIYDRASETRTASGMRPSEFEY
jgi:hypothetical protein